MAGSPEGRVWVRLGQDVAVAVFIERVVQRVAVQLLNRGITAGLLPAGRLFRHLPLRAARLRRWNTAKNDITQSYREDQGAPDITINLLRSHGITSVTAHGYLLISRQLPPLPMTDVKYEQHVPGNNM